MNGVQAASVVLLASSFARSWTVLDGSPVGVEFSVLVDHASLASQRGMKPGKHGNRKISADASEKLGPDDPGEEPPNCLGD